MRTALFLLLLFLASCCHLSVRDTVQQTSDSIVRLQLENGSCTGFYMEGRIVTAGHCVETLDDKITAIDIYGHKHAATPIYDNDKTDVAVLSVTNLDVSNLYLDSSDLVSGDQVVTLGWPFYSRPTGKLAFEVGYILGDIRDGVLRRILATDCTARGMSGGPVLRNGQVIGLVSAVLPQTDMYDYSGHMSIKNISIFATADAIREALNETDSTTDIN